MGLIRHILRVFFRSHFKPINPNIARRWEFNSTMLYFFFAWTAFGFSVYHFKKQWQEGKTMASPRIITAYDAARKFGGDECTIIKFKGFNEIEREVVKFHGVKLEELNKGQDSQNAEDLNELQDSQNAEELLEVQDSQNAEELLEVQDSQNAKDLQNSW